MYVEAKHLKKKSGWSNTDTVITCQAYQQVPAYQNTTEYGSAVYKTAAVARNSWTGWDVPNFHRRRRRGELIPHTPWRKFSLTGNATGTYDWISVANTRIYYGGNYPHFSEWILSEEVMTELAPEPEEKWVQEAAAQIYGNGWDLFTFIAEFKDVKKQFLQVGRGLLKLRDLASVRKMLARKTTAERWKLVTNEWLSARYGWRPLYHDIKNMIEAVQTFCDARNRFSERSGTSWSDSYYEVLDTEWAAFHVDSTIETKIKYSVRGSVTADIDVPSFQVNPLQTGWEVIPFSFVVDWIIGIGTAISAISFLAHVKAYSASTGILCEAERTMFSQLGVQKSNYASGIGYSGSASSAASLEIRKPCRISYTPHVTLKMNGAKYLDLATLIFQRFKTTRR